MKLIPISLAALFVMAAAEGCKSKKEGGGPAPNAAAGTPTQKPSGEGQQTPSNACASIPSDVILCVCVEGGFNASDGTVWDYDCCIGQTEWYFTCGESATCSADTFQCRNL